MPLMNFDEGLGVLGFQFERKKNLIAQRIAHKLKRVEKVNEMCVIDIYRVSFVKSFYIQRGQNGHLINDKNRGCEKICLKAYNHHCPLMCYYPIQTDHV